MDAWGSGGGCSGTVFGPRCFCLQLPWSTDLAAIYLVLEGKEVWERASTTGCQAVGARAASFPLGTIYGYVGPTIFFRSYFDGGDVWQGSGDGVDAAYSR